MKSECVWILAFLAIFAISPVKGRSNVMRVHARNYAPFIYQNATNGQFYDGIEFHLIKTIAKKLGMQHEFQSFSSEVDLISSM